MNDDKNLWVVIPAAGVGKRMQVNHPKQYLLLDGKTILERTLSCFSPQHKIMGIVVVVSKEDAYWAELNLIDKASTATPLYSTHGGKERCHSVLNGLLYLADKANANDWVMVHDAARPFLHADDIAQLKAKLWSHPVGGLLGLPVADTLKYCGENLNVKRTVSRAGLWRALTPQMFQYQALLDALNVAINYPDKITDEASAMEMAGYEPMMVEGRWDNIKITHPQDLSQAQLILKSQ